MPVRDRRQVPLAHRRVHAGQLLPHQARLGPARAYAADQLFATLDTTTRQLHLDSETLQAGRSVSLSDNALSGFNGVGNVLINTGAQVSLQAGMNLTINIGD